MDNVILTRRLTKYYGPKCVVDSVGLRVPQGCVYGLLGRNAAGKSTLIKMLLGMVHPSYGHAELFGEDAAQLKPETRARIAYLAEGHPLYGWMTVGQAARFTRAFYPGFNERLLEQILDHFDLPLGAKIRRLSHGQRAQVSLALAVAQEPELLILDDPTLGLDTVVRRDFLESLIQIIQRKGRTVLFSSHILGDVERVAERIGILVDGVLRVDCPTEHFKESIRKVVMEFDGPPPALPPGAIGGSSALAGDPKPWPGLVNSQQVGNKLELVVVGFGQEHLRLAESLRPRSLEVLELNLEEAFIEYTRGPKRSLPIFVGDQTNDQDAIREGAA